MDLLGAPHIEQMRGHVKMTATLSAVRAVVVGVVLNLAVWFGMHVLLPDGKMLDWFALALSAVAFIGLFKWKWGVISVVVGSGLLGLVYKVGLQL
jgi:chromate transporter